VSAASPDEIRALERRRLRSLVEADLETARILHSPDYHLITPGGVSMTRDDYLGQIASGELDYAVFEPEAESGVAIRQFAGGAAVRYVARIVVAFPGGTDDARFWHTDLWESHADGWHATWSQATRIPAPRTPEPTSAE
jgi:uncharacterized protein DUF4440